MDLKAEEVWSKHKSEVQESEIITIKTSLQYNSPKIYLTKTSRGDGETFYHVMKAQKKL